MTTKTVSEKKTAPKTDEAKPAAAPVAAPKTLAEVAAALPKVKDDPRVQALVQRTRDLGRQKEAIRAELEKTRSEGQVGFRPSDPIAAKAQHLASGGTTGDPALREKLERADQLREDELAHARALELLGPEMTQLRLKVGQELAPQARELAKPFIRRAALALLAAAFAQHELAAVRSLIGRCEINHSVAQGPFPQAVFNTAFIQAGAYLVSSVMNFLRKLADDGVITDVEFHEWRVKFTMPA